jgi:hypothetical protein
VPALKEDKVPARKENKVPAQKENKVPAQKENKVPAQKENKVPALKENKVPAQKVASRHCRASQPVDNVARKLQQVGLVCQGLSANTPKLEALSTTCSM